MAAGQTIVAWGDTTFYNVHTKRFHQETFFDESVHHSPYAKTTIEIAGVLHGASNASLHDHAQGRGAGTPASSHKRLRAELGHPRRRFEMRVGCAADGSGGEILFECNPSINVNAGGDYDALFSPSGIDLNGGPKCTSYDIQHIAGNSVFRVTATFEICKRECSAAGDAGATPNPIKSFVWSVADDIDQNFTTSRTYVGRLVLNHSNLDLNSFRDYVVPPLLPGMMRRNMRFDVDKDQMTLDFSIVDREVHYSPPAPATSWHFTHRVEAGLDAMTRVSTVDVTLAGDRYTPKKVLINLAMQIIEAKLLPKVVNNDGAEKQGILEYLSVTDVYGDDESRVHATARVRYAFGDIDLENGVTLFQLGLPLDGVGGLPGYDSNYSRGSIQRGDETELEGPISWKGAIVAAFGNACGRYRKIAELARTADLKPIRGGDEEPPGEGDPEADVAFRHSEFLPNYPPTFMSLGHAQAMFLAWKMETFHDGDEGMIGLPVAGRGGANSSTQQDTARFVRLHPSIATRTIRVTGERVGVWPDMPTQERHTDANGIVMTPLKTKILAPTIDWTPDGQRLYRVSAEFVQGLSRPPGPGEAILAGYNPWDAYGLYGVPGEAFNVPLGVPGGATGGGAFGGNGGGSPEPPDTGNIATT